MGHAGCVYALISSICITVVFKPTAGLVQVPDWQNHLLRGLLGCQSGSWIDSGGKIPVVANNASCDSSKDTLATSLDRKTVFGCQANKWQLTA